jgi:hypothetical protein
MSVPTKIIDTPNIAYNVVGEPVKVTAIVDAPKPRIEAVWRFGTVYMV